MRTCVAFLFLLSAPGVGQAQAPAGPLYVPLQIRTLTIVSSDLEPDLRKHIISSYQGKTYAFGELEERISHGLRDLGYAKAAVGIPQLASMPMPSRGQQVDVTVQISAGAIYRLGSITFTGNKQITNVNALREQFPLKDGDLFNATAIGKGLENLMNAYESLGYINFGTVPKPVIDEQKKTVSLTIDMDEGRQYFFGRLLLDGVEPHPGMAQALENAWKPLEGAAYNPRRLAQWLGTNATFIPNAQAAPEKYVSVHVDDDGSPVNVRLQFP